MSEPLEIEPAQEVLPPEPEQALSLLDRIDALAAFLAEYAERDKTPGTVRVKIFGELVNWSKVKRLIHPEGVEGGRLKEFHNVLKSGQGNRIAGGSALRGAAKQAVERKRVNDASGAEIRRLIRSLPTAASPRPPAANTAGAEREGERDSGAGGGGGVDVSRDGEGDGHGALDSSQL